MLKSRLLAETASAGGGAEAAELQHQLAAAKAHTEALQQQMASDQAAADSKLQDAQRSAEKATHKLHVVEDECARLGQEVAELQVWPPQPLAPMPGGTGGHALGCQGDDGSHLLAACVLPVQCEPKSSLPRLKTLGPSHLLAVIYKRISLTEPLGMQEKLGQGHYNPATTRVLHLVHNPAAEAEKGQERARAAQLTGENAALKVQLAQLKTAQSRDSSGSAGQPAEDPALVAVGAQLAVAQHRVRPLLRWRIHGQD